MTYYVKSNMSAEILLEADDLAGANRRATNEGTITMIADGVIKYWHRAYVDTVRQRKWKIREYDSDGNLVRLAS